MNCPFVNCTCELRPGEHCPDGCALPHICSTCGRRSCIILGAEIFLSHSGLDCWIPPYRMRKGAVYKVQGKK